MIDVYNKSVFDRNSIQEVPAGYIDHEANDLFRFMGSFWKNIHRGKEFIGGIQNVRGIKLAQFYLDLLESLKLQDRKGMPVFHRELWKPLILRKSQRNTAQENILKLGTDIVLGEQPAGSKYGEGTVLQIGSLASLDKYVTYPVDVDIKDIVSGITNNVINPSVTYKVSTVFPSPDVVYMNGSLIFPIDKDPFSKNSAFEVYDCPEFYEETDPVTGEKRTLSDQETVLWASDALIDKDYIKDHMSYALGIECPSSDITKRIINAGWDAINCGLTPSLFRSLLAAMANVPVVQEKEERITEIHDRPDGNKVITTNAHSYTVYKNARLRSCIKIGEKMHFGDFFDESLKVYPLLTDVSEAKLAGITEYADILKEDIPVISLPGAIIRTNLMKGLAVDWTPTEIVHTGMYDANNHEKVYFKIAGLEEDVENFWEDVWGHAERNNVDIMSIFAECLEDSSDDSPQDEMIVPVKFFLKYMIGVNTLIVTLDNTQLEDSSLIRSSMFFELLNSVIPAGMRLFFIEHTRIDDDADTYAFGDDLEGHAADVEEETDLYAAKDIDDDEYDYSDLPGLRGKRIPTYDDQIEMKLFRNRKRNAD